VQLPPGRAEPSRAEPPPPHRARDKRKEKEFRSASILQHVGFGKKRQRLSNDLQSKKGLILGLESFVFFN